MKTRFVASWALAGILMTAGSAIGIEIKGKVVEPGKEQVKISTDSEWLPAVGDPVEIYFEMAGFGETLKIASGKVAEVGDVIVVKIEQTLSPIERAHFAKITSVNPRKRGSDSAPSVTAPSTVGIPSVEQYLPAARQGDAFAQVMVCAIYGCQKNWGEWYRWGWRKPWSKGDTRTELASEFRRQKELADGGSAFHAYVVARLLQDGIGADRDAAGASVFCRRAADQGLARAQGHLGWCYQFGHGVPKDSSEALRWLQKGAEAGDVGAQWDLALAFEKGWGTAENGSEARRWYAKAAEAGFGPGQSSLGWCYERGVGGGTDYEKALVWYRKAADLEQSFAENKIGEFYENGLGSLTKDMDEAIRWYRKAAARGHSFAKDRLKQLGVGELPQAGNTSAVQAASVVPAPAPKTGQAAASVPNTLTAEERAAGWKLLFDGRTLEGWQVCPGTPDDAWQVEDGCIVTVGERGVKREKPGYLCSIRPCGDFELSFQWKVSEKGNSGIFYRVGPGKILAAPQYQVIDNGSYQGADTAGSVWWVLGPSRDVTRPVGEFNDGRIVCRGSHLEHWLNGVKVVDCDTTSGTWATASQRIVEGYPDFGTSVHGVFILENFIPTVWFRNIKLRPLGVGTETSRSRSSGAGANLESVQNQQLAAL
jgi:TPR repeat protein